MSVTGIGATRASFNGPLAAATDGKKTGKTGTDDFLKLLTTQLRYQNPLDPVNDSQFVSQLSQISTVEGIAKLNSNFGEMLLMQNMAQGASLIGKTVTFDKDGKGTLSQGKVQSLQVTGGKVALQVGGASVDLTQVRGVTG